MTVLVTGGAGQLGRSVARRGAARGLAIAALGRAELDVCDESAVERQLASIAPGLVIHAASYTRVDDAERDAERAFAVNTEGARIVAAACARHGIPLLHVSTDYVFAGDAATPYREGDPTAPLNVYGRSKAESELLVLEAGGTVVRTSWLFSAHGPSFVQAIVRLAVERPILSVVDDQRGCPTWADDLAEALLELGTRGDRAGIYHYCNEGETTRHAFALAIVAQARRHVQLACERIDPISSSSLPQAARRPTFSVLDTSRIRALGIATPPWGPGLARTLAADLGGA